MQVHFNEFHDVFDVLNDVYAWLAHQCSSPWLFGYQTVKEKQPASVLTGILSLEFCPRSFAGFDNNCPKR